MAFFMDRHDLTGVSAEDIAAAHVQDLGLQDRYRVRYMSYWFDYQRQAAFCLVEAPNAEAAMAVHRDGHGHIASEIIPVDPEVARGSSASSTTRPRPGALQRAPFEASCSPISKARPT